MATLHIVNHLFKLYFKINERFLCKPLVKAVHSPVFLSFEQFSVAQRVTYKYYVGQLAIFDDSYQQVGTLSRLIDYCLDVRSLSGPNKFVTVNLSRLMQICPMHGPTAINDTFLILRRF